MKSNTQVTPQQATTCNVYFLQESEELVARVRKALAAKDYARKTG